MKILLKERSRISEADELVAQALENLSLDERSKMSETMRRNPALADQKRRSRLYED